MTFVYDVEIFPNFFSIVLWDINEEVKERFFINGPRNDYEEIMQFFTDPLHWWVGYNSSSFDDPIMQFLIDNYSWIGDAKTEVITGKIYDYAQKLIEADNYYGKYKEVSFNRFDLMRVGGLYKSLKMVAIDLKHDKIQDLPYSPHEEIDPIEIENILNYNENDVHITYKLYHDLREKIQLRQKLSVKYGQNLMNYPDSGIANKILENDYWKASGVHPRVFKKQNTQRDQVKFSEIILDKIEFKTDKLNDLLEKIKSDSAGKKTKIKYSVLIGNTRYDILKGGLHSNMLPEVFETTSDKIIIDADVTSYYLYNIINHRIKPEHLHDCIVDLIEGYTEDRVVAKQEGDKVASGVLKIIALSLFGKMGNEHHWLYDLKALYQTTLNGQLFLLMLIEDLEDNGIRVFYGNTDGITAHVPPDKEEIYYIICKQWEQKTGFNLEYEKYKECIIRDVNNYIWIPQQENEKIKYKGFFDINRWQDLSKSFDKPVVPKAVSKYFTEGVAIEEFIRNHKDIFDFCMAQKVGDKFRVEYHYIDSNNRLQVDQCQETNRYFIGKPGGALYKTDGKKHISLASGESVVLLNDVESDDASHYSIDYDFYIKEARKIIELFNSKQGDLFS